MFPSTSPWETSEFSGKQNCFPRDHRLSVYIMTQQHSGVYVFLFTVSMKCNEKYHKLKVLGLFLFYNIHSFLLQ